MNRGVTLMKMKRAVILTALTILLAGCGRQESLIYDLNSSSQAADFSSSADLAADGAGDTDPAGDSSETSAVISDENHVDDISDQEKTDISLQSDESQECYVYVCGAVQVPGVYVLSSGSRVYEAIAMAGGMTEEADDRYLNQAAPVSDGQKIIVYTQEEIVQMGLDRETPIESDAGDGNETAASEQQNADAGRVNLNEADRTELMTLPGIGEARADAIIRYREENGGFQTIEDIKNIDGIKDKAFEKIKDYIEV